jgi:GNAT superfamily N-acetyltransferase
VALVLALVRLAVVEVISLGFRTDVMLRGLEGSEVVDHADYVTVRTPGNPDFWWGNFLLLAARATQRNAGWWLSQFSAEFPDAAHVALGLDVTGEPGDDLAGFAAAGLELRRETVLTASALCEPPHPNRAAVFRPLAGDGDWGQSARLQALSDAADGVPASRAFIEARNGARRRLAEAGHGAWFGAFLDDELVSQLGVFSGQTPFARYQDVVTHPGARRQGLAGTLVYQAGRYALDHLGAKTLVIVADPHGAAIRVYHSVGFADHQTQVSMQRPPSQV